jgi:quinol monooxygenase YgiN
MQASEASLADTRDAAAAALGGQLTMERFELVIGFRHTIPARGAVARLSRFEVGPARVEEAITLMQEEALPRVKGAAGLCSFQMLIDRESGAGALISAWEGSADVEAFWPTAEQVRARASDRVGIRFDPPENYTLIRTTVQLD